MVVAPMVTSTTASSSPVPLTVTSPSAASIDVRVTPSAGATIATWVVASTVKVDVAVAVFPRASVACAIAVWGASERTAEKDQAVPVTSAGAAAPPSIATVTVATDSLAPAKVTVPPGAAPPFSVAPSGGAVIVTVVEASTEKPTTADASLSAPPSVCFAETEYAPLPSAGARTQLQLPPATTEATAQADPPAVTATEAPSAAVPSIVCEAPSVTPAVGAVMTGAAGTTSKGAVAVAMTGVAPHWRRHCASTW